MAQPGDATEPEARILADVSALADGTLDDARVESVRALIAASPELRRRYEQERRAVAALRTIRSDRAPARLRLAVDKRRRPAPVRRTRLVYGGAVAAVAAAVAATILLLPGAAPGSPSVSQAAGLALRGPAMPAPRLLTQGKLTQDVQDVYFPDWSGGFGWRAAGQRIDHVGGRLAVTVFYQRGARQLAYTILAAPALGWPRGDTHWLHDVMLRSFSSNGRLVMTWRRGNHTCVLSASGVSAGELARLAAWKAPGATT